VTSGSTVQVTSDTVLGSLSNAAFLGGSGGQSGSALTPPTSGSMHVPPAIVSYNPGELASIGVTGPNNAGQSAGVTPDQTGQHGSVGGLEQDGKPPPGLLPPHHH
jgi:hypothetical protein